MSQPITQVALDNKQVQIRVVTALGFKQEQFPSITIDI